MADDLEANMREIGAPGLNRTEGFVREEWLNELKGDKKIDKFKEMRDNDPIVGGVLTAVNNLIRQADWQVEPASDDQRDKEVAEFLDSNLRDMDKSFQEFVTESMSMIPFGWSLFEIVYKRREGNPFDPVDGSQFDDGRIGIKKLSPRGQETLWSWEFDENGDVEAFVQQPPPNYSERRIPAKKFLLFRAKSHKNNPEGQSALRNAYRPWYFKKRIEEIEGIGVERDLAGMPVAWVPPRLLGDNLDSDEQQTRDAIEKMLKNVRNDEQSGIMLPAAYDGNNKLFDFELMSTGGRQKFDTNEIIDRYNRAIAMSMLADFILIGHEGVGSFALASSKTSIFSTAIESYMQSIADEFNRKLFPQIMTLNGMRDAGIPELTFSDIETINLTDLSRYIKQLSGAGVDLADEQIHRYLLDQAGIPSEDVEVSEDATTTNPDESDGDQVDGGME